MEFFDIRDAAKALKQMNGKEIHGKPVAIEFSRPGGGHSRKFKPPPSLPHKFWPRFALGDDPSHCSHMKSTVTEGSHHDKTTEVAMASMNLGEEVGSNGGEERHSQGLLKRNSIRKHSGESTVGGTKHQQQPARSRHRKGKDAKKHETRFLIKEDATVESSSCIDSRTTVMIKNIPNKYRFAILLYFL